MARGIKILNSDSEVQIDGNYRNISEVESDTSVTIDSYPELISITNTSLVPIIAIRPSSDYFVTLFSYVYSSPNYTDFNMITEIDEASDPSSPPPVYSTSIDWKLYSETPSKSADIYGLRVYNSDSDLVFDSGKKYFDIVQVDQITLGNPTINGGVPFVKPYEDITHSAISNPYYILSPIGFWWYSARDFTKYVYFIFRIGLKQISATSVRVGWFCYWRGFTGGAAQTGYNPTCNLITCDVH